MANPNDLPNLYAWYRADSFNQPEGSTVGTWTDKSGNGRHMVAAGTPAFRLDVVGGQPAVEYVNSDGDFHNVNFAWSSNMADHTVFAVFKASAGPTQNMMFAGTASALGAGLAYKYSTGEVVGRATQVGPTVIELYALCPLEEWHFAYKRQDSGTSFQLAIDGGVELTNAFGTQAPEVGTDARLAGDGGAFWSGQLAEAIFYSTNLSTTQTRAIVDYLRARYFAVTPAQNEQMRDVLSRRLWNFRRANGIFSTSAPLWMLDADILDRVASECQYGPGPGADDPLRQGWRGKVWQRHPFSILRVEDSPEGFVRLTLLDRRSLDVLLWETGRTDKPATALNASRESGVARIMRGNVITFTRATRAFVVTPSDPSSVSEIQEGRRAFTAAGEWFESARTNEIKRSSFLSGTTGLTLAGTGTGGSAIATDPDDLFFNREIAASSLKFTAGSPHSVDLSAAFPVTVSFASGTDVRVSVDHKTDSGEPLHIRIQRAADSFYWNDDTGAFQAGLINNPLPTHGDRDPAQRWKSKSIDVGGSATTLTVTVLLPAAGTSARVSHLYHVQLEVGAFAGSRIVTDDIVITRAASVLSFAIPADPDRKCYNPALGTFFCEVIPDWSSADLTAGADPHVYHMTTDGGLDRDRLFYDAAALAWVGERKVGGNTYQATMPATVIAGTVYKLGFRWTGVEGELNLAPYTLSLFLDGVKGTDAVSEAPLFSPSGERLFFGSDAAGALQFNGALREKRVYPGALEDEEVQQLP